MIDLNSILDEFIKPEKKSLKDRFLPNEERLKQKFDKYLRLKDMIKLEGWQVDMREKIQDALRNGFGKLLRPTSLHMTEAEIKSVMAEMQAYLSIIQFIVYNLEEGEDAARKLGEIERADKIKSNRR